jgi:hypothetical protein
VRIAQDVPECVGEPIAWALGYQQRPLVEHAHESRRVAARAHVTGGATYRSNVGSSSSSAFA